MTDQGHKLSGGAKALLIVLGLAFVLAGLGLAGGGVMLIARGGSWYYLLMGLGLIAVGAELIRGGTKAAAIYTVAFLGTVLWAFWEAGLDFWALHARIFAFLVAFVVVMLVQPLVLKRAGRAPMTRANLGFAAVLALAVAAFGWGMFQPHGKHFADAATGRVPVTAETQKTDWDAYGGDAAETRFAAIDQINRDNVKDLQVAWTFHTGETPISPNGGGFEDQNTPMQIGNSVFLCTASNTVISVNAATGAENWRHEFPTDTRTWVRCRGLAYFDGTKALVQPSAPNSTPVLPVSVTPGAVCERRIFMNTIDAVLVALDADTGVLCPEFGTNGTVDLKADMGEAKSPLYTLTSPPTVAGTTVVVGGRVADNVALDMPGGVIRGFDVVTGQMKWAFDPGNPTDQQAPVDGATYTRSTPNVWAPTTYDAWSNTIFLPVGNAAIDLWGVERTPEDEKYGASILALDATTGAEKWVYQTVHHDLWDFDIPMGPTLIDFTDANKSGGGSTPALTFGTKAGQIFVLDRLTGQPLTEVTEIDVKPATIPDEKYALKQKLSSGMPQIGAQKLSEADMWGMTPFDQLACRVIFKGYRYEGLYTAPDTDVSLSFPGSLGGLNWGGMSYDPTAKTLYVNDMRLGLWVKMVPQPRDGAASNGSEAVNAGMGAVPLKGTPYSVLKNRFLSPLGVPCQEPPFGTLTSINVETQSVNWEVPLGTVEDTVLFGQKMRLPMPVGMPTIGGSLTTQGGLVFFAATQDYYLRAFDSATGKEVWKARMPVGSQGTPISYVSPETGKQYVLISAGGARQSPDRGDYVIAYALPE